MDSQTNVVSSPAVITTPAVVDGREMLGIIETTALDFSGPTGVESSKVLRRYTNQLRGVGEVVAALRQQVAREQPRDYPCAVGKIRMNPITGGLYCDGKNPDNALAVTHSALQQACSFLNVPRNACANLEYVTPGTRAAMLYDFVRKAEREAAAPLVLRTMVDSSGRRFIRAVVTETHSQETGDDLIIADAIESLIRDGEIEANARARWTRSLTRSDVEIILPSQSWEMRVGDIVFAKVHARNSETKHFGFQADGGLHRLCCLNGNTRADESSTVSVRHVGELVARIRRAIQVAGAHLEEFAQSFKAAYSVQLPQPRAEMLKVVGTKLELPESTLSLAAQMWDADGDLSAGNTVAGLVNALTRASQNETYENAALIEGAAGELITHGLTVLGLA
jgi:hypothetical protein